MNACELVKKIFDEYEVETGKSPTEVDLDGPLYDSLIQELRAQAGIGKGIAVSWVRFHGVLVRKRIVN